MNVRRSAAAAIFSLTVLLVAGGVAPPARAHITPPVILLSDRDAVVGMLQGASRFFARDVRLAPEDRTLLQHHWDWQPDRDTYRFYLGRDQAGQLVGAVIFLTEMTIHGPVRVAVGITPDGKVKDAAVLELTEETYAWMEPFLARNFTQDYIGKDSRASFALSERFGSGSDMPHFYARIVASLVRRGVVLYEVTVRGREGTA